MNPNPRNYYPTLVFRGLTVESIPYNNWRSTLASAGAASYFHSVRGSAVLACEDGVERSVPVELSLYGKKRFSGLGGLVAEWRPRPSRGPTHAQCETVTVTTAKGKEALAFKGGTPVFTDSDILGPDGVTVLSQELGLCYTAKAAKGKTLCLTGVELELKKYVSDGETKVSVSVRHFDSVSVIDRPAVETLASPDEDGSAEGDDEEAPVSKETATVRQAARKTGTQASPAQSEAGVFNGAV